MAVTNTTTVADVLNEYGAKVTAELTDNLEHDRKNASGNLSSSIKFQVRIVGQLYTFELTMAEYWKFVDKGRRPGKFPPREAILQWMTNKRIGSFLRGSGKNKAVGKKSILATNLQAQRSIAYLIGRKIARKGIKGSGFYTDTFKSGHAGDVKTLEESLSLLLERDVKVMIEEIKEQMPKT